MSAPPPKKPGGFGLYGDLINPDAPGVISGAPVKYDLKKSVPEVEETKKKKDGNNSFLVLPVLTC